MLTAALSRALPPPSYLTMPCVGVDISDTSLKYVSFTPTFRRGVDRTLEKWGEIDIPSGIVNRGQVLDPEKLVAILKECQAVSGAEFVRVSLPEERAYMFETELKKNVSMKEVKGLLEFRLEENVPIPSRDVLFDFAILPHEPTDKVVQIAVAAYAKETINTYYDACLAAGMRPLAFEVEAQAMARAVVPQASTGATMLVDFGKTRTGIGIVYQGTLLYTSTVDIGGEKLSQTLRKTLGDDIAESELTRIKNTEGLIPGVDSSEVHELLLPVVSLIKDELATRMQYWHMRSLDGGARRISSIVLTGGSSNLKGLPAYLTESLGVPATRGNVWENAFSLEDHVPPIDRRHSFGYATAIGLALKSII